MIERPALDLPRALVLALALIGMSVSGPLTRFALAAPLAVVLWRVTLAWPVLAGGALWRREPWPWRRAVPAGLFLALHWVLWVTAIQSTAIASAATLITTSALWAALLSRPLLGEPLGQRQWLGLVVGLLGVALVVLAKGMANHTLRGDLIALAGAWAFVAYSFIGRRARQLAGFWSYTATLYLTASLTVLAAALLTQTRLVGFSGQTWGAFVLLALLPTLLGHGGINYLLRYLGPARLGLWTLLEPVAATLIAWPLFGEVPTLQMALGGLLALFGVALGVSTRA